MTHPTPPQVAATSALPRRTTKPTGAVTVYAPTTLPRYSGKCRAKCAGGNDCDCNSKYTHYWHICHVVECVCHLQHKGKVTR